MSKSASAADAADDADTTDARLHLSTLTFISPTLTYRVPKKARPKLFSKDTLARRCAKRFGWDPQNTAKLAQDLYDQGYLSYPRTESEHLPESQMGDAGVVIASTVEVLPDLARFAPAAGDLMFRRGSKGHYVKD